MNDKWIRCFCWHALLGVLLLGFQGIAAGQTVQVDADADYETGMQFLETQELTAAVDAFEQAVSKDPDMFFLMTGNGIFERLLKTEEVPIANQVVVICKDIIKNKKDNDFFVYYYLGWAELNAGNTDEAILKLEKAQELMKIDGIVSRSVQDLLEQAVRVKEETMESAKS